jgi:N-acetylglucosaminyldiphosphoundecaprenol N-acetyl-beta-D-mannosaminyltransferase
MPALGSLATLDFAGTPIAMLRPHDAVEYLIRSALQQQRGLAVHLCNAYTLSLAASEPPYRAMLTAGLNLPDGMSVVLALNALGARKMLGWERVAGPDLFEQVIAAGRGENLRHYLLGSTEEVVARLKEELRERYPGAEIVAAESPPFRPWTAAEWADQVQRITDSAPHIVWVGLGTPQQDWVSDRLATRLPMTCIAIGAAFDFAAGTKRRAPRWMQRSGLEWLHRLASEPRRLWRRYAFCLPIMLKEIARTYASKRLRGPGRGFR